jgi:hypothetical protein
MVCSNSDLVKIMMSLLSEKKSIQSYTSSLYSPPSLIHARSLPPYNRSSASTRASSRCAWQARADTNPTCAPWQAREGVGRVADGHIDTVRVIFVLTEQEVLKQMAKEESERGRVNNVGVGVDSEGHITYMHVDVFGATEGARCAAVHAFQTEGALDVDPRADFLYEVFPDDDDLWALIEDTSSCAECSSIHRSRAAEEKTQRRVWLPIPVLRPGLRHC